MTETADIAALQSEQDPTRLREAAMRLADSASSAALDAVGRALADAAFLSRLDDAKSYDGPPHALRVARVLERLEHNAAANAGVVLVRLTQENVFAERLSRTELLILAIARLRPPPNEVLRYWAAHAKPGDSSTPLVVKALFKNDTEASLRLFGQLYASDGYDDNEKILWLRTYLLPVRDNLNPLAAALRIVKGGAKPKLKEELLRVIFAFNENWFPAHGRVSPPNPLKIDEKAKAVLLELGDYALADLKPPPDLKLAIEARLKLYRDKK